jgi:tRNA pseudouridine38-40 synthase
LVYLYCMTRYFTELSFKGTHYHGWQVQPNAKSIQEVLNHHLSLILGEKIELTGAGRTDTGVHASYFMAHMESSNPDLDTDKKILQRINGFLPPDISIHKFYKVYPEAHARFDATSRSYNYFVSRRKDPFQQDYSLPFYGQLDVNKMNEACKILLDKSDFAAFCKKGSEELNQTCTIFRAEWKENQNMLVFQISANRFLRNMVRALVGTFMEIGRSRMNLTEFQDVFLSKNRSEAGESVPGKGLFLCGISYPANIFINEKPKSDFLDK